MTDVPFEKPSGNVYICRPATLYVRGIRTCPDCGKRGRWAGFEQAWYGISSTCLNCGRHWSDGEWMPLPFRPQAREESIRQAREWWDKALAWRSREARAWLRQQIGAME